MAYSEKLIDHYEAPRNVGSLDKNDPNVGTGLVGAPACGDVMKLQIRVSKTGIIEDARFKTFGCLTSNNLIATTNGYTWVDELNIGDEVWAWNGTEIVSNTIRDIVIKTTHYSNICVLDFGLRRKIFCTKDHVWWGADGKPVITEDLVNGTELLCALNNEFKSLNNVGRQEFLKEKNSKRMLEFNKSFDHSSLPQNTMGYVHSEEFCQKISASSKKKWTDPVYIKNWQEAMAEVDFSNRPTELEKKFIALFKDHDLPIEYVGDSSFWIGEEKDSGRINFMNPDFKVIGENKVIEVYTSKLPSFMQNRSVPGWETERKKSMERCGFEVMFIEERELPHCLENVSRFIHNGLPLKSIHAIEDKRGLRGMARNGDNVFVYDIVLNEGANVYFVQRAMSHNCGSAIASSSLATELIKGKTLDEALSLTNKEIVEELSLPPVKIHCSILAEDAIKAAIADYRKKKIE